MRYPLSPFEHSMLHPMMSCGVFFSHRSAFQTHALQLVRVIILASFIIFREQLPVCLHHVLLVIPFCVWPSLSTQLVNLNKLLFQTFSQRTRVQKPLTHFSTQAIFCYQSTQLNSGFPMTLSGSHKVFNEIVHYNSLLG